jgi:hypothetical protein
MSLEILEIGGVIGLAYDSETLERGIIKKMVNKTGVASVKGSVIDASPSIDNVIQLCDTEFDAIGIIAEDGVADGDEVWVWTNGSTCQVLWKDSTSATRGYVALAGDVAGRAIDVAVPSANPSNDQHWKEIGHVLESKIAGTNVLVLCNLHFN